MADIKLRNKQDVEATYTGVNVLEVPSSTAGQTVKFVETSSADAVAGDILTGKSAYVGVTKVQGSMANNGNVSATINAQGGSVNVAAGYTSGGTITANITPSTLDNTIISGTSFEETTGDYGWRSTVNVPAGYHNAQTIIKDFSSILPAPSTPGTASEVKLGYQFYDKDGKVVTGTMPNNGAVSSTISEQGGQYTVPAGYHDGSGTVTATINHGSITSGAGSATVSNPTYNSTSGKFNQTVSGTVAAPTVGTAGYVSFTAGTKNTNTVSGSKELAKIVGTTSITGTKTYAPTLTRTAKPTADTWTDAASGAATTTKPTSGVYVQIDAASNTGTITATPSVTTEGYGTSSQHGISGNTVTVGAAKATTAYVPITAGSAATPATTVYTGAPSVTFNASNGVVSVASKSGTQSVTPTVSVGYVTSGTAGTITATSNATSYTVGIATMNTPSGSATQSKPGLSFNASNGVVSATVAATSGTAYANITGAGYIATGTKSGTFTMSANSNTLNIGLASINTPSGSATQSKPGMSLCTTTGVITASVAATSGTAYANITGAGYIGTGTKSGTFTMSANSNTFQLATQASKTVTPSTSSQTAVAANTYTLGAVTVAAMPSGAINNPSGSATQSKPGMSLCTTTGVVTATVAATSGTCYRNITTAGYLATSTTGGTFTMAANSNTLQIPVYNGSIS